MDRLSPFPHMNDDSLRTLKKSIDDAFRAFARSYGDRLETLFSPLQTFLIQPKRLMTQTPWPIVLVVIAAIAWVAIRLTDLGIRLVDRDTLEAADAFGSSSRQKLWKVQMPLALPTIMAGINQTIMMALAMVVIASMIGVQGLGQPALQAISHQYFTLGVFSGLAIVGIAIIYGRVSQAYGRRLRKHREIVHG